MIATRSSGTARWLRLASAVSAASLVLFAGGAILRRTQGGHGPPAPAPAQARATPTRAPRAAASPKPLAALGRDRQPSTAHEAIVALLDARAAALLARDRAAYAATVDPAAAEFRASQLAMFANLAPVPLASWSYVVDDSAGDDRITDAVRARHHGDEVYAPPVGLRYKLSGFDTAPTELTLRLTFVRRGPRWYLASDTDFDKPGHATARELWDFAPVDVVRTAHSLVLGPTGRRAYLVAVARDTDAAVPRVTAVWGKAWSQRVVVLVPTSQRQVSDLLGTRTALSQIAAVAVSQVADIGGAYRAVGSRVVINPPNFDKLTVLGRRVVLAHEVTHVASRNATGPSMPAWLVEGFADYVGYRGAGVDPRTAARELGVEIRRQQPPKELPTEADFNGANPKLALAYESSWLACRMIAERYDEATLLAFYLAVGKSKESGKDAAVSAALSKVLAATPAAFTASWRRYVRATFE